MLLIKHVDGQKNLLVELSCWESHKSLVEASEKIPKSNSKKTLPNPQRKSKISSLFYKKGN